LSSSSTAKCFNLLGLKDKVFLLLKLVFSLEFCNIPLEVSTLVFVPSAYAKNQRFPGKTKLPFLKIYFFKLVDNKIVHQN
jgi:hypothetical protein